MVDAKSDGATTRNFRVVQKEGSRSVNREIEHFNLDVIISSPFCNISDRAVSPSLLFRQFLYHI